MNFGEVSNQLIKPTNAELHQMIGRKPPEYKPSHQKAIRIAMGWISEILADDKQPPSDVSFYAFEGDGKDWCDVIRVHYPTALGDVEIAQTFCLISIVINWKQSKEDTTLKHVFTVAKQFLKESERIDLEVQGENAEIVWGGQKQIAVQSEVEDFINCLRWWTDGYRVGFVTLKKGKHPGRAVMSWAKEFNLDWFNLYEK